VLPIGDDDFSANVDALIAYIDLGDSGYQFVDLSLRLSTERTMQHSAASSVFFFSKDLKY